MAVAAVVAVAAVLVAVAAVPVAGVVAALKLPTIKLKLALVSASAPRRLEPLALKDFRAALSAQLRRLALRSL